MALMTREVVTLNGSVNPNLVRMVRERVGGPAISTAIDIEQPPVATNPYEEKWDLQYLDMLVLPRQELTIPIITNWSMWRFFSEKPTVRTPRDGRSLATGLNSHVGELHYRKPRVYTWRDTRECDCPLSGHADLGRPWISRFGYLPDMFERAVEWAENDPTTAHGLYIGRARTATAREYINGIKELNLE